MLKSIKIAITGDIAAGKSSACQFLKRKGAYVINADRIVNSFFKAGSPLGKQIIKLLGNEVVTKGRINKKKIAQLVFNDLKKLKSLERLLHPKVIKEIQKKYEKVKNKYSFFVVEMPLLFETKMEKYFDLTVVVTAKTALCKSRFKFKDYSQRKKRLLPIAEKMKKANFIIENNGTLKELQFKVLQLLTNIKTLTRSS